MISELPEWPAIPGGWTRQELQLCERPVRLWLPANPDAVLEGCEAPDAQPFVMDPYWARLWPTSQVMAKLVASQSWPTGQRALELGCGIGVVGLAALFTGLTVTFSDHLRVAVELAVRNAQENGFRQAGGMVLNWHDPATLRFPVILGSDVLYDPNLHEPLIKTIDSILEEDGICWLGDPGRYHAQRFVDLARELGWQVAFLDAGGHPIEQPPVADFVLVTLRRNCV